jgi:hypothetical protein
MENNSNFLLDANKDWSEYVDFISRNTGKKNGELWLQNARENSKREHRWAAEELLDIGINKTVVGIK